MGETRITLGSVASPLLGRGNIGQYSSLEKRDHDNSDLQKWEGLVLLIGAAVERCPSSLVLQERGVLNDAELISASGCGHISPEPNEQ